MLHKVSWVGCTRASLSCRLLSGKGAPSLLLIPLVLFPACCPPSPLPPLLDAHPTQRGLLRSSPRLPLSHGLPLARTVAPQPLGSSPRGRHTTPLLPPFASTDESQCQASRPCTNELEKSSKPTSSSTGDKSQPGDLLYYSIPHGVVPSQANRCLWFLPAGTRRGGSTGS